MLFMDLPLYYTVYQQYRYLLINPVWLFTDVIIFMACISD